MARAQNGEITDPPVSASSNARYALSIERPSGTASNAVPNDIFCDVCIQNQHFFERSLAEYYPTPTLATFEGYEQAEAEYRASLEQRYPLVCKDCEPLARQRLKDTSYAAKVDNMRRIMERTRPELRHLNEARLWKLWTPFLGGLMWKLSWAGQIVSDLIGVMRMLMDYEDEPLVQQTFWGNVRQSVLDWEILPRSNPLVLPLAKYALFLGLISAWWNPRLRERIGKRGGRMVGIGDYYTQQLIFLAVRGAALYWITSQPNVEQEQAAHLFLLVFSLVAIVRSHHTLTLDFTPKANWHESPKSLLSQPPRRTSSNQNTPTGIRRKHSPPRLRQFPIESLSNKPLIPLPHPAPSPSSPNYTQPSFLPSEDRMDWAPTLPSSRPYTSLHPPPPFKHPLPAAANPSPNLSIFSNLSPTTNTIPPQQIADPTTRQSSHMADPKFFPPTNAAEETGLESLFSRTFTISHPPAEVRDMRAAEAMQRHTEVEREVHKRPARVAIRWRVVMLMMVVGAYVLLFLADGEGLVQLGSVRQREVVGFGMAASVVAFGGIVGVGMLTRGWVLTVLETLAVSVLGGVLFGEGGMFGEGGRRAAIGQLALACVGLAEMLMLGRECVRVNV